MFIGILLVSASFFTFNVPKISATDDLVTVTATNHGQVTVVEYKNKEGNIFEIKSVILEVDKGGNFKSFKTEKGWMGKKTSADSIMFTSTIPIKPGESAKFGVKTDKPHPVFNWKALDKEGDELGAGGRITTEVKSEIQPDKEPTTTGTTGITEQSTFKIVPATPKAGSTLRIIGENFAPKEKLDFYINDFKIDSFVSDDHGNFILSTKIPESQLADRADFIIKDQNGNQKSISLRIGESSSRIIENTALTLHIEPVYHRGDERIISGTTSSGNTVTISISDSNNQVITTYTVKADSSGKYSTTERIPSDIKFGEYIVTITDEKDTVIGKYVVESTQKIVLVPLKDKYEPGETVIINGTAIPDKEIEFTVYDSVGMEYFSEHRMVGSNGTVTISRHLDIGVKEGTYVLTATQGTEFATVLIGIGQVPSQPLFATMDSLNYKTTEKPKINIIGPPSAKINLIIIDPSDKQKFTDSFSLGVDGYHTYSFNLTGYTSGIYTAVISRGNVHAENKFSVGLQTTTGTITLRTLQETYHPGESILLIGDSNPNVIITVSLTDPNSTKVKTQDVFTDKKGTFSSSSFRIPFDAPLGVWKLEAGSGINHVSKDLTVSESGEAGITVHLDKSAYKVENTVQISGNGAGKSHTLIITILKGQEKITELNIVSTGSGTYSTIWKIPTDFALGPYTIKVSDGSLNAETTFTVQ